MDIETSHRTITCFLWPLAQLSSAFAEYVLCRLLISVLLDSWGMYTSFARLHFLDRVTGTGRMVELSLIAARYFFHSRLHTSYDGILFSYLVSFASLFGCHLLMFLHFLIYFF